MLAEGVVDLVVAREDAFDPLAGPGVALDALIDQGALGRRGGLEDFHDQLFFVGGDGTAGQLALDHRTPDRTDALATIEVGTDPASPSLAEQFATLRRNPEWVAERARIAPHLAADPDKTLAFVAELNMGQPEGPVVYTCPMHPDVVGDEPGRCSKCGMALLPAAAVAQASGHDAHMHHADTGAQHHGGEHRGASGGIAGEDEMVAVNRRTTPATTRWKLVDGATGAAGPAIDWEFRVGDQVKPRLVNEPDSDHPMHHPFHVHGAGRFVVLARDGVREANLVWKDTVLVRTGQTVALLLDVTNPGVWMARCHIAEHHESGMMLTFHVNQ